MAGWRWTRPTLPRWPARTTSEWLQVDHPLVEAGAPEAVRRMGGQLARLQHGPRRSAAERDPGRKLGFFMYPQSETAQGRRDSLDPDTFKYTITTREIKA